MFLSTESRGRPPRKPLGHQPQDLRRALEPLREALRAHHRSLEKLENTLRGFEEAFGVHEERQEHPQAQQGGEAGAGSLDLLSIPEVCQELGMGKSWVYKRIQSGEIPSVKLGRNIKVRREDLQEYLEAQRNHSAASDSASE